jgi:7,8-dihydropterin-6-yl-methyl-4-(beta-D-ribofuranosyl)aminobenzene 5'-phosphate synthase
MFDYGIDPSGIINNMQVIGLAPYRVETLALSHGHFDHWCGLEGILAYIEANNPGRQIPLFVGKGCFSHRLSIRPGTKDLTDLGELRRETIEQTGRFKAIETEGPEEVVHGIYTTGRIERTTSYEKVPDNLLVERDGVIGQDHFDEDMALFGIVKGKGLVIISGCAHAGIVNTIRHIQKITAVEKVHAIIGGFHLVGAPYDVVERTIEDIGSIGPDYIIPAHCTGFYAIARFAQMLPDRFVLNTAGTTYRFG